MRILVPWRAFGDLEKCRKLIPEEETELLSDIEAGRQAALRTSMKPMTRCLNRCRS